METEAVSVPIFKKIDQLVSAVFISADTEVR
jgi:hypothetical protein